MLERASKRTVANQQEIGVVPLLRHLGKGAKQGGLVLHRMKPRDIGDISPGRVKPKASSHRTAVLRDVIPLHVDPVFDDADVSFRKAVALGQAPCAETAYRGDLVDQAVE